MSFDIDVIRSQFPVLQREIDGVPLVYLDNAATTQKPQCVIDSLTNYYSCYNSNVHRGAHQLADEATQHFEAARDTIAQFINASAREEVIWTSGTTEAINLVANGLAQLLKPGDEIVVTEMEHHANLVPWQQACQRSGAILKIAPIDDSGTLLEDDFTALLGEKTRMVAFPQVSNALGTVNPVRKLCLLAKAVGAWVLVDGAQGIAHGPVDVQSLGCDFYAFSGHKLFGPTGIGVLWGRKELLADWPVWKTGGEMISTVTYQNAQWNTLPYRFEAGTPHIAGAIGMAAAVNWFSSLDMTAMQNHESALLARVTEQAKHFEGLHIIGSAANKIGILSFILGDSHSSDIGFMLDRQGIAVRAGHHCAEPLMARFGVTGTARASFSLYNTMEEVDRLFTGLHKVKKILQ